MLIRPQDLTMDLLVVADLYTDNQLNELQGELCQCEKQEELYEFLSKQSIRDLVHIYTGACKLIVARQDIAYGNDQRTIAAMCEHVMAEKFVETPA